MRLCGRQHCPTLVCCADDQTVINILHGEDENEDEDEDEDADEDDDERIMFDLDAATVASMFDMSHLETH